MVVGESSGNMWCLCVLCVLLSPVQGLDPGVSDRTQIFAPPGSDVLLPLRYNLTVDKEDKSRCDGFLWEYKGLSPPARISRSLGCVIRNDNYTFQHLSNYSTSLDGHLTLISVTKKISGNYTVYVYNPTGHYIFSDNYTLHVQAPVSEPLLNISCLRDGGADIFCSTDPGEDSLFSILVNGESLLEDSTSSRTEGKVSEVNVTVKSPGPWNITCSVRNRVNDRQTNNTQVKCPVPLSNPVLELSCLHNGSLQISCSVQKGSDPRFSLSVNSTLLLENVKTEKKMVNVSSPSPGYWDVHCAVRNSLGGTNVTKNHTTCPVPLSDPVLNISCLRNGSLQISCSVENGSDPIFFSLLVNTTLLVENVTTEKKMVNVVSPSPGPLDVQCAVRNSLGKRHATENYTTCPESTCLDCLQKSIIGGVVALIVTTSPFLIASFYIGRNTRDKQS